MADGLRNEILAGRADGERFMDVVAVLAPGVVKILMRHPSLALLDN